MKHPGLLLTILLLGTFAFAQEGFRYDNFYDTDGLSFHRPAHSMSGIARLVNAENWQSGGIWYSKKPMPVSSSFETSFDLRISQPCECKGGGDGLALVIHGNDQPVWVGDNGEGIGYQGIPNSIAIELDAFDNQEGSDHHISLHSAGRMRNNASSSTAYATNHGIPDIKNGKVHKVVVKYIPGRMKVYMNNMDAPVLDVYIDIENTIDLQNGRAWLGITAATGSAKANHDILRWDFNGKGANKPPKMEEETVVQVFISELPNTENEPEEPVFTDFPEEDLEEVFTEEEQIEDRPRGIEPTPEDQLMTSVGDREVKRPSKIVVVHSPELTLTLWDNNKKDGDIVSLNLNGTWIINSVKLKHKKQVFVVRLSESENQLVLHAHNLGRIPPNTASIGINDGQRRQVVTLQSNLEVSESITLRYEPKD
jgi:hypothetical protein